MGIVHTALLVITLAVAREHDGSPSLRVFWAIIVYFVEIAVYGAAELVLQARYGVPESELVEAPQTKANPQRLNRR